MAWRVVVAERQTVVDATSGYRLRLLCHYYDDTDPANATTPTVFLWSKEFLFDGASLTLQIIQDAVFTEGARQRTAFNNAQQGIQIPQLAVGQTYLVP